MIKALLFDLGGVLIHPGDAGPMAHLAKRLGLSSDELVRRGFGHPLAHAAIVGAVTADAYWRVVAADLGLPVEDAAALGADFTALAKWDEPLLAHLRNLKPHYKLGVITGAMSDARAMIESQVGLGFFDVIVVTAEERLAKPDPELYLRAVQRLGITPQEAIFFDDWLDSVEGARAVGLQAVHVGRGVDVIAELDTVQHKKKRALLMFLCLNAGVRTTLDLPDALFRELKAQAALRGMKLKDLLTMLVEQGLRQKPAGPRRRSPLPVARRTIAGRATLAIPNATLNQLLDDEDAERHGQHTS